MGDHWTTALVAVRVLLFLVGAGTTLIAYRAYRRRPSPYLRDATLGFGFITVGVFVEGVLYQWTTLSLTQVHIVESLALGVGFLVLLRSFLR
ncbi:MAG: hypothetical protein ABEJ57_03615 [Halobacteriaceae archaeon]